VLHYDHSFQKYKNKNKEKMMSIEIPEAEAPISPEVQTSPLDQVIASIDQELGLSLSPEPLDLTEDRIDHLQAEVFGTQITEIIQDAEAALVYAKEQIGGHYLEGLTLESLRSDLAGIYSIKPGEKFDLNRLWTSTELSFLSEQGVQRAMSELKRAWALQKALRLTEAVKTDSPKREDFAAALKDSKIQAYTTTENGALRLVTRTTPVKREGFTLFVHEVMPMAVGAIDMPYDAVVFVTREDWDGM